MIFEERVKKLKLIWYEFQLNGNVKNQDFLKKEVLASWKRCREANLDPYASPNDVRLSDEELAERINQNKLYIEAASLLLEIFTQSIDSSGFRFDLFDTDLYLLEQFGDNEAVKKAQSYGIVPGVSRNEMASGTTALSLVDELRRPVQLAGPEHYNINLHFLTCSSTPIFLPDGTYLGILSMSGDFSLFHKHTLGLVVALGRLIEQTICEKEMVKALESSREHLNDVVNAISDGIIVIDKRGIITTINQVAGDFFGMDYKKIMGTPIEEVFGEKNIFSKVLATGRSIRNTEIVLQANNHTCRFISNIDKIENKENLTGVISTLKPMSSAKSIIKNMCGLRAHFTFENIIGKCDHFRKVVNLAEQAARVQTTVLLQGESGTGKEVFAQAIHNASQFRNGPFVALNCAAIPGELIESELFGYESGAFTGARKGGRQGKFELAENGTIFLDEISSMPLAMQAKLLRVIQTKRVVRLGGNNEININARLICASNRDLWLQVQEGTFREDLFFRINVISIDITPLRKRVEDIPLLTQYFCGSIGERLNIQLDISDEVFEIFCKYSWPGNIRELENVIERSIVIAFGRESPKIELQDVLNYQGLFKFWQESFKDTKPDKKDDNKRTLKIQEMEVDAINKSLNISNGNLSQAAKLLGISRPTLYRKIKRYGIECSNM